MKIKKSFKKYIKKLYAGNNKTEKQYLILEDTDDFYSHLLISGHGNSFSTITSREAITELKDRISETMKIFIVHNHPGFFSKSEPSTLDRNNQVYVESILNSIGCYTHDYLIYSRKNIYSFKEKGELYSGLANRKNAKILKMNNGLEDVSPKTIRDNQEDLIEMLTARKEALVTVGKTYLSDSFPIEKLEGIINEEKGQNILILSDETNNEKRFVYYKQLLKGIDEIFCVENGIIKGSFDLDFYADGNQKTKKEHLKLNG